MKYIGCFLLLFNLLLGFLIFEVVWLQIIFLDLFGYVKDSVDDFILF